MKQYVSFLSQPFRELVKNVDSRDQPRLHGSSSKGGVQESAFWRNSQGDSDTASPALYWDLLLMKLWSQRGSLLQPTEKLLQQRCPGLKPGLDTAITSAACIFSVTTWSLSAYQDKITDNKGLENNRSISTEATIPHPCKNRGWPCTQSTAAGHPHGDHQGMVTKGLGGGREEEEEPDSVRGLTNWQPCGWQRKHSSWQTSLAWSYNGLGPLKQRRLRQQRQTLLMAPAADAN